MIPLGEKWRAFLAMALDPLSVGLVGSTVFLSIVLVGQSDRTIVVMLTFLVAMFSGVLGGVWGKRWDELTGERVIVARGKSAIRSLKLLLGSAVALERRAREYLARCTQVGVGEGESGEGGGIYLEEVVARCVLLEEGILSSVESWTDIIPEADVKTQIGVISELTFKVEDLTAQVSALGTELQKTKGKSREEIQRLRADKREKERELLSLRRELSRKSIRMGLPLGTAAASSVSLLGDGPEGVRAYVGGEVSQWRVAGRCRVCGSPILERYGESDSSGLCSECRSKAATGE